jgi:type III pantothenate kinase
MIVVVDAGNSRLKWGLHDGHGWVRRGVVENTNVARLTDDWQDLPSPQKIVVSNVAGAEIKAALELCVQRWHVAPCWVVSQAQASGVTNRYADPAQLGPDRWAALIAAHQVRQACIVVNAGTAVTIDALTKDGIFLGGLILPGAALMRAALSSGTAGVQAGSGHLEKFPANTADAVYSGALQAAAGAVERLAHELDQASAEVCTLILSGGSADELLPLLNRPVRLVDNLVLDGLVIIAREGIAG